MHTDARTPLWVWPQVYKYGTRRTVRHQMKHLMIYFKLRAQYKSKTKALEYARLHGIGHHASWLWRSRLDPFRVAVAADKLHQDLLGPSKRLQKALIAAGSVFRGKTRSATQIAPAAVYTLFLQVYTACDLYNLG